MTALHDRTSDECIFAPFVKFHWIEKISGVPLGVCKKEADNVAWLLSCSPYVLTKHLSEASNDLRYAMHLLKDIAIFKQLHRKIMKHTNDLISIKDVESELKFEWKEIDLEIEGRPRRIDPYFWKLIEGNVRMSCREYVRALDEDITQLSGLCPSQRCSQVNEAMERMIRGVGHHLADCLLSRNKDPTTDHVALVGLLQQLQSTYSTEHVQIVKDRLRVDIEGLVALNRCSNATASEFDEVLQDGETAIARLVSRPPNDFINQLTRLGIHLHELSSVFCISNDGLVIVRNAPPASFGVRASALERWLNQSKNAKKIVSEACAAQIIVSLRLCDLPAHDVSWSNTEICRGDSIPSNLPLNRMVTWRPPSHLGDNGEPRVLVTTGNGHAVRACRVMEVLLKQAKLGMLPTMTIRGEALLPVVSRFIVENEFNYGAIVDTKLRPFATAAGCPWPEDTKVQTNVQNRVQTRVHKPARHDEADEAGETGETGDACASVNRVTFQRTEMEAVPIIMRRDHAVLHAIASLIKGRIGVPVLRINLDDVCSSVRKLAPALHNTSTASLKQIVAHVAKRAAKRAVINHPDVTIEYSTQRSSTHRGRTPRSAYGRLDGIVCDASGADVLLRYVEYCMQQMRFNGKKFASQWSVSRTAITHARAANRE